MAPAPEAGAAVTAAPLIARPDADGIWLAPAKLNLMLRVLGRRADGYHRLQTVFQFLDRGDRLSFTPLGDGRIERAGGPAGVLADDDLVVRAARALQQHTGCSAGVEIRLDKRLPMGGGLGGGSSDAATTLHALNRHWGLGLPVGTLAAIGLRLGADVPVFVHGFAAWAEGVGEALQPVTLPEPWFLVLTPPCHVATAAVFGDPELTRDSPPITIADFVAGDARNDCLAVVLRRYPPVVAAFEWLNQHAVARLTGTGGCVFAAFDSRVAAEQAAAMAPAEYAPFVARGCNRSPLMDAGIDTGMDAGIDTGMDAGIDTGTDT